MLRKSFSGPVERGFLFALLAAFSLLWLGQAHAERRAAIIVGNSEYPFAPLTNPRSDAKLIANTLTELNFDVLLFYDVKKSAAKDLKDAIRAHLLGADMAVFYYAGHALQYNGQNLLLPVDTRISSAKEVAADAMMLNDLIDIVKDDPVGMKVFILDACRNNPAAKEKGLQQGLAYTEAGSGQVLVAFATSAGEVAYDGTGINSPYSSALANALVIPNLDVYDTFRTVRGDVRQATGGAQIPWITGSIETKFVFRQGDTGKQVAEAEHAAEASGGLTIDEVLWSFISDSQNPEDFERFVKVFPNSRYAAEAAEKSRVKVAALTERGLYVNGNLVSTSIAAEAPIEASGKALSEEFVFQQAGERAVSETFRVWPSNLPDTQRGMRALVTDCDLYAADPNDPQRQVPGVTNGLVNVRDALRACAFSLAADINNPRLQFQFGRVLEIARRYSWAEHFYELAGKAAVQRGAHQPGLHGTCRHGARDRLRPRVRLLCSGRCAWQSQGAGPTSARPILRARACRSCQRKAFFGIGSRPRAAGRMRSPRSATRTASAPASSKISSRRPPCIRQRPTPARSMRWQIWDRLISRAKA